MKKGIILRRTVKALKMMKDIL